MVSGEEWGTERGKVLWLQTFAQTFATKKRGDTPLFNQIGDLLVAPLQVNACSEVGKDSKYNPKYGFQSNALISFNSSQKSSQEKLFCCRKPTLGSELPWWTNPSSSSLVLPIFGKMDLSEMPKPAVEQKRNDIAFAFIGIQKYGWEDSAAFQNLSCEYE